jgi:hypothetical protein
MIDSLQAPTDLGTARARLRDLATAAAVGGGTVAHLQAGARPDIPDRAGVVVADMVLWQAGGADLRALSAWLGPDGVLVFLEPTAELGWRRLAHRLTRGLCRRFTGHDFERDLPASLRSAGLEVTELDRFGIGPLGLGSYALGRAEHIRSEGQRR